MRTLGALLLTGCLAFGQNPPAATTALKSVAPSPASSASDVILRVMKDELERGRKLSIASLDPPYFIEYTLDDVQSYGISATLGALFSTSQNRFRYPRVRVRVGSYDFDNTNYIGSDFYSGTRYDSDQLPIDDDYNALRRSFWLATDRAFKGGVEAIARKRAALKNVTQDVKLPDFWKAEPLVKINPGANAITGTREWETRIRKLSTIFGAYPDILASLVSFDASSSVYYLHNSEGTTLRRPEGVFFVRVTANALSREGMQVYDSVTIPRLDMQTLPADAELETEVRKVADNVKALVAAPLGETYAGPVLVEGVAAAQLVADVLAPHFRAGRQPVSEPGRPSGFMNSELEGRIGSRIFPEFIDVVDDPKPTTLDKQPLIGHYDFDEEGTIPGPLTLIAKGQLKGYLYTRQPVKGATASNGRARLPGAQGARTAAISNLFVKASETQSHADLKKRLLQMITDRGKPYGIIIRKIDFPSSAPQEELRRIAMASRGATRPASSPLLVYRVYPDGKEELIRGLRFRGVSVRSFRDVLAVSDTTHVFHYLNNLAPFNLGGGFVAPASVVAPSMLFDDLELEKPQDDVPTPPIVPVPPLESSY